MLRSQAVRVYSIDFDILITHMKAALRIALIFMLFYTNVWAADMSSPWYTKGADNHPIINVELFLSSTCPHCKNTDAFFHELETRLPYLHVQRYFINTDQNALIRFNQLLNEQQMNDFAVPSIYICNSRWVGFASAETTGKDLLQAIDYCKQQIEREGKLTQVAVNTLRHWSNANLFDAGLVGHPSGLNYTFTIALMDSFAPCAFFCFAGFMAFILIEKQRKKQLIASLLYMASVALVHYIIQVDANGFFTLLPWLRIPAALTGLLTLYFVVLYYKKQPVSALYYVLAVLLGLIITLYQQTCVMNWAAVFEQWLNNQHLSYWQASWYQLLYQAVYIVPLMLIFVISLFWLRYQRFAVLNARLAGSGLLFLLAIALILIVYPLVLASFTLSIVTLVTLTVFGYMLKLT